jgi:hypothetical protein
MECDDYLHRSQLFRRLSPASFFEKKQAIDNATKVANFGTLYWAHLRLGRLNGPNFYCVRGGFRR